MTAEISFDLIMEPEMPFVEGTFRIPGQKWEVFIFSLRAIADVQMKRTKWDSGVSGVVVKFPKGMKLNKESVMETLAHFLHVEIWREVRGPDSMQLR